MEQTRLIEPQWYAVYTRSKCEKSVSASFQGKSISHYLPLLHTTKRYTRKIKHYQKPLITCYVFIYITPDQHIKVLDTPHVLGFIKNNGRLSAIPEQEILLLKQIVGEYADVSVWHHDRVEIGEEVELIRGNLCGLRGKIVQIKGKKLFTVRLENIGISLSLDIEIQNLRRLKGLAAKA